MLRRQKKAGITDNELWLAIQDVMTGQCDNLGGGVFKKRLNKNQHRSIILTKYGEFWIYEYLFAKKDRDNIREDELLAFRSIVKLYATLTAKQFEQLLKDHAFVEVVYDEI